MITNDDVLHAIRRHGEETYPEECCGLLLGITEGGQNVVEQAFPTVNRNEDRREDRYVIAPDDYRRAETVAQASGLDIVGIYHSHPDHPARPSQTDLERATFPGFTYIIVSVEDGEATELTAWSLARDRSRFEPETVESVPAAPAPEDPSTQTAID